MKPGIRSVTREPIESLKRDGWPSPAACVDFVTRSPDHLESLPYAVLSDGVTVDKLERALGKGEEIQKLITPWNPYWLVTFRTDWDELHEQPGDELSISRPLFGTAVYNQKSHDRHATPPHRHRIR